MKRAVFYLLLLLLSANIYSQKIRHVIVLGIDGCSPDGIIQAPTPNIDPLVAHGSWTYEAKAQMPTVSSPNWASLIDGVPPSKHGIWSNSWQHRHIRDSTYCGGRRGQLSPTIFKVLRQNDKHAQICCLMEWWSFKRLVERHVCSLRQRTLLEATTDIRARTVIKMRKPEFLFIHFNNVDEAGHKYGHGTRQYYNAVARVDRSIGKVVSAVKKAGILESTVFIIVADHGGIGKGHGGNTPQEVNVPFIFSGAGIKQNHHIKATVNNYDLSPTIARMFGAKVPECWENKVIREIFE